MKLGLKGSIYDDQFSERIKKKPKVLEFHLFWDDLFGVKRELLESRIQFCQEKGIEVYLHHPMRYRTSILNMFGESEELKHYYKLSTTILAGIIKKYNIYCVVHANYGISNMQDFSDKATEKIVGEILYYNEISDNRILWENSIVGFFSYVNPYLIEKVIKPYNLNICFDMSHAFISYKGCNEKLIKTMREVEPHVRYYHVVDSVGEYHDSLQIGTGKIDWKRVKPFLEKGIPYIYEIGLKDQTNSKEMVQAHKYLQQV